MENIEFSEVIKTVIEPLLSVKEALFIKRTDTEEDLNNKVQNYVVCVDSSDLAKLLTNHGVNANAIRELVNSIARSSHKKVMLKFESLSESEEA